MSEIDDLEFIITPDSTAKTTEQRRHGLKQIRAMGERGTQTIKRQAEFRRGQGNEPSLPRLKFLERED